MLRSSCVSANIKSAEEFLEKEPDSECILKEGVVKKRVVAKEISWRKKYISLTDDRLLLRNQLDGDIRDTIELRSITHVRRMVESAHCAAVKGVNEGSFRSDRSDSKSNASKRRKFSSLLTSEGPHPCDICAQ